MKVFHIVIDCQMIPKTAYININFFVNKNVAISLSELAQADDVFSFKQFLKFQLLCQQHFQFVSKRQPSEVLGAFNALDLF